MGIKHFIKIMRPLNCIMSAIAVYISALVAGSAIFLVVPPMTVFYAMLVVFLVCSGGMVANDIFDIEIDKVNKPDRPLPSGKMSMKAAKAFSTLLMLAGIAISYFINYYAFFVAVAAALLLVLYAWKLKRVMLAGNITVSLLVGFTFIYGGLVNQNFITVMPLALLAFLSNMGREIYKTAEDVLGDKKGGADTLAVKFGVIKAKRIASIFIILAVLLSFVPFVLGILGLYYLIVVVFADILFLSAIVSPVKRSSKLAKIAMLVALIAFLIGAVYR
ncbi:MAG: UbiA family prenyltransferase [Candidatus Aenigmarchaeota archaeon]|nr:UbiA family prenyltransferase [Candidatus Aenigmarchaeota archaeon]